MKWESDETHEFSFEGLPGFYDEQEYEECKTLIIIAAHLFQPDERNEEYERGIAELITERLGLPLGDWTQKVHEYVLETANFYWKRGIK